MKIKFFLFILFLFAQTIFLSAQDPGTFNSADSLVVHKRWAKLQPKAVVCLKSGDTIKGQPLSFDMESLVLYPSDSLLPGIMDQWMYIPFEDIRQVILDRGGRSTQYLTTGITAGIVGGISLGMSVWGPPGAIILGNIGGVGLGMIMKGAHESQTHAELDLESPNPDYAEDLHKLKNWSVFEDSVFLVEDMSLLLESSKAVQRVFQPAKFRISFAVNTGFVNLEDDIQDALVSSGMPKPYQSWHRNMGLEFVDLAWRFKNKWIVGGGLMKNVAYQTSVSYYKDGWNSPGMQNYDFRTEQTDFRAYVEYAPWPIDWFPVNRTEILFGGGLIFSRPTTSFNLDYLHDTITWNTTFVDADEKHTLLGVHARASAHFYITQSISLSLGLEGNLYQNLYLPAVELPEGDPALPEEIPVFNLNYSTIRMKFGAHFCF